jgi:hypothetical protein
MLTSVHNRAAGYNPCYKNAAAASAAAAAIDAATDCSLRCQDMPPAALTSRSHEHTPVFLHQGKNAEGVLITKFRHHAQCRQSSHSFAGDILPTARAAAARLCTAQRLPL